MKKNIILLLDLALPFLTFAQTITEHNIEVNADPFTCDATVTIKSSLADAKYIRYYKDYDWSYIQTHVYDNVYEITTARDKKSMEITLPVIYRYQVIVAAGNNIIINAPQREHGETASTPVDELPKPWEFDVERYDVYYITVEHPVVEHFDTIYADMLTGKADFPLYSTAGTKAADGRTYCGDRRSYYIIANENKREALLPANDKQLDYTLSLSADGQSYKNYKYYVMCANQKINSPARAGVIKDPENAISGHDVYWTDLFYIHVVKPECRSNLVYRKWDDLMFVNNGKINGGGDSTFVAYQWYAEGNILKGETKQWMQTNVNPNDRYYAKITDKDGKYIFTCPCTFDAMPQSVSYNTYQKAEKAPARKIMKNGQLLIERDKQLYTITGERVE